MAYQVEPMAVSHPKKVLPKAHCHQEQMQRLLQQCLVATELLIACLSCNCSHVKGHEFLNPVIESSTTKLNKMSRSDFHDWLFPVIFVARQQAKEEAGRWRFLGFSLMPWISKKHSPWAIFCLKVAVLVTRLGHPTDTFWDSLQYILFFRF